MDSTRLVQIRKDFYLATRDRVESIIGRESPTLQKYRSKYEEELKKLKVSAVHKRQFINRLKEADIVLVGDFHVLKQSSRGLLRILRKVGSQIVLCVECLSDADQDYLNTYLSGELSEKDFLSRVQWRKNWSFPWENYRPLFKWAQQHKVPVYGINSVIKSKKLRDRDKFSAQILKKVRDAHPDRSLFVQYGDLHLASKHLPCEIKKELSKEDICVVYQSPEIVYFKVMEQQKELTTDVVKLTNNQWALNVVPPWVKWQDYLLYLEGSFDKRVKKADSDTDLTDLVSYSVKLLSESFGFNVDMGALSVYSSNDDSFFEAVENLQPQVRKRVLESAQEGHSFYIPELEVAYLSRLSVNHVSKIAAQYIYFQQKGFTKTVSDPKKDFLKLIWLEMVTYLCSKFANPKRKSDTLQDIRTALQKEQFDDRGKEALMLALNQKLLEMQFISSGKIKSLGSFHNKVYNKKSYVIASQILGGIMGEKFYYALNKKHLKLPVDKKIIFKDLQTHQFTESYYEALELVESWPIPFKSKFDKL